MRHMKGPIAILFLVATHAAAQQPDPGVLSPSPAASSQVVDQIVRRIQDLAPKETVSLGIETELRAASLLQESRPDLAAAFRESGERRLAAHPEVRPSNWTVSSLLTLDPEHGEEAILKLAEPTGFDALLEYYFTSDRPDRGAAVLQKAIRYEGPPVIVYPRLRYRN